jgi:hypothetical protein
MGVIDHPPNFLEPEEAEAGLVYKASERAGTRLFEPRPFWQLNDFARSGSAADPQKVPPGATFFRGVYATRESFVPFYFPPRDCPRFSIEPWSNDAAAPILDSYVGALPRRGPRVIVFRAEDRDALERHGFALDVRRFRTLPTREYLSDSAVAPLAEVRHQNALAATEAAGWAVRFVNGLEALRRLRADLQAAGVSRFSAEKMG